MFKDKSAKVVLFAPDPLASPLFASYGGCVAGYRLFCTLLEDCHTANIPPSAHQNWTFWNLGNMGSPERSPVRQVGRAARTGAMVGFGGWRSVSRGHASAGVEGKSECTWV